MSWPAYGRTLREFPKALRLNLAGVLAHFHSLPPKEKRIFARNKAKRAEAFAARPRRVLVQTKNGKTPATTIPDATAARPLW